MSTATIETPTSSITSSPIYPWSNATTPSGRVSAQTMASAQQSSKNSTYKHQTIWHSNIDDQLEEVSAQISTNEDDSTQDHQTSRIKRRKHFTKRSKKKKNAKVYFIYYYIYGYSSLFIDLN